MEERLKLFLNKKPESKKDRLVRLFIDNEVLSKKVTPFYCLTDEGEVSGGAFLSTTWCKNTVRKKIKENLSDMKVKLKEEPFCTPEARYAGFWVELSV